MNLQTVSYKNLSFINVSGSGQPEMHYLRSNFEFSSLHLEDHVKGTEIPKIEETKNYTLIVLGFPYFKDKNAKPSGNGKTNKNTPMKTLLNIPHSIPIHIPKFSSLINEQRIHNTHVDIFVGKDHVVVLHDAVLPEINHIFTLCQRTLKAREEFLGNGASFLVYKIIDALVDGCFPVINQISNIIDGIDRQLEKKQSPSTLEDISTTRRNVVVFHTMVKTIIPLFNKLRDGMYKQLNGPMQSFWSNILDHLESILDRLEDDRELIEGISESNEFLLRSKSNEIVKVLTIFSAILLPLNLIASIYGMNLAWLPFAQNSYFIVIIVALMGLITVSMLYVFRIKGWF